MHAPRNNNRRQRARNNGSNKSKNRKVVNQNQMLAVLNSSHIPKSGGLKGPFPQNEIVRYRYFERLQISSATQSFVAIDFRMNSVWQPRSGGPTGTCSGYNGSAFRFANYHVEGFKLRIRVNANDPNLTMSFGVVMNDTQIGPILSSYTQAQTYLASSGSYLRGIVGETSGMSRFISKLASVPPGRIVGDLIYNSDRDYVGTLGTPLIAAPVAGTNPNQAVWATFILLNDNSATALNNGCFLDWDAELVTRNFSVLPGA